MARRRLGDRQHARHKARYDAFVARDEAITIPTGETRYDVMLDEHTVRLLAQGICPETLAQRMFRLLGWEREQYRVDAQNRNQELKTP